MLPHGPPAAQRSARWKCMFSRVIWPFLRRSPQERRGLRKHGGGVHGARIRRMRQASQERRTETRLEARQVRLGPLEMRIDGVRHPAGQLQAVGAYCPRAEEGMV